MTPAARLSPEQRTQFAYLLNAFEQASQADEPSAHGYAAKRQALFAYVRGLENRPGLAALRLEPPPTPAPADLVALVDDAAPPQTAGEIPPLKLGDIVLFDTGHPGITTRLASDHRGPYWHVKGGGHCADGDENLVAIYRTPLWRRDSDYYMPEPPR